MMRLSHNLLSRWLAARTWARLATCVLCIGMVSPHVWALELNQANEAELDGLRGMGPSLTRKVLAARALRPFSDWADFRQRVSGIGQAKAAQFSEQGLTVAGQVFQAAP